MVSSRLARPGLRRLLLASVALAGLGSALSLGPRAAGAQDGPNPSLVLSFGSVLSIDDNRGLDPVSAGTTTSFDTSLGLVYQTETATSTLRLETGTVLRLTDGPSGSDTTFDDPTLRLSYSRTGASSRFSFTASQRQSPVAFFDPLDLIDPPDDGDDGGSETDGGGGSETDGGGSETDGGGGGSETDGRAFARALAPVMAFADPAPVDPGDLITGGTGTRADKSIGLRFQTGIGGPLGLSLGLNRRARDFSDTTDPDQFDTVTDTLSLGTTLRLGERTSASLTLSSNRFSAEDATATERRTNRLSLGLSHALNPVTSVSLSLGQSRVSVEETVGATTTREENDGLNGSIGITRDLANGTLGLTIARDIAISGARTDITLNRSLDLPRGGLKFTLGTSQGDGDSTWIGSLDYRQELARGAFTATLDRRVGLNDADADTTTTRARIGLSQDLSARGGVDVSLDYLDVDSEVAGDDRSRARLRLAYTWDLTADWQMAGGLSRVQSQSESSGNANSNTLFLSLQRGFTFAP